MINPQSIYDCYFPNFNKGCAPFTYNLIDCPAATQFF